MSLLGNAGLGKKALIENWLKEMNIRNYFIDQDMTINVNGPVYLWHKNLTEFPNYIQFDRVSGFFDCSHNNLKSLQGCPKEVGGYFDCSHNNLISLKGCPEIITDIFMCSYNELETLECGHQIVIGKDYYCCHNNLKSLQGCPKEINGAFDCSHNQLKTLEYLPKFVRSFIDCSFNPGIFYIEHIKKLCKANKYYN